MNATTIEALLALNRSFYERFAGDFARTRRSSPPGFDLIVPYLQHAAKVVDLGCGNGRLLVYLAGRGWRGHYIGLDNSAGLLTEARRAAVGLEGITADFVPADLMQAHWPVNRADLQEGDALTALAVLHHIPGNANRLRFMETAARLLPPGGCLIVSTWQFMSSARLRKRLLPWAAAGLNEEDVEQGDYLMSWGEGAAGQRYVAAIGQAELSALGQRSHLTAMEIFTTDGLEGDLNLYGVFRAV